MTKKIAVVLSGCGYLDGAEIRESVIALLALDRLDTKVEIFAPDIEQKDTINHLTGKPMDEKRNILVEAARIARGKITDLVKLDADNFDALVLPGGFGVAKNLSDLAVKGKDATVLAKFKEIIIDFIKAKKPIAAICISPAILVAAIKNEVTPTVTLGTDNDGIITALGGTHITCTTDEFVFDESNKIASCSAYMQEAKLSDVASGIEKVIKKVVELA